MRPDITAKTLHDQWRGVLVWTVLAGLLAAFYLSLYPSIGGVAEMQQMLDAMPEALRSMFAAEGADIGTPSGYLNIELFAFMIPLLVAGITLMAGSGATAGEEERGTLELLLANPVARWRVVVEKFLALVVLVTVLCAGIWVALAVTAVAGNIDLALDRVGAALASAALFGIAIGALAMAIGAITGSRWISIGIALGVAVAGFFVNALAPLVTGLESWQAASPFYHYIGYDPLANGLDPIHASALAASALLFLAIAAVAFERRDLRG